MNQGMLDFEQNLLASSRIEPYLFQSWEKTLRYVVTKSLISEFNYRILLRWQWIDNSLNDGTYF